MIAGVSAGVGANGKNEFSLNFCTHTLIISGQITVHAMVDEINFDYLTTMMELMRVGQELFCCLN